MPANLTPMYYKAERDFRRAQTLLEQFECLQLMLKLLPKHKGTDKLQAEIRARISDARKRLLKQQNAPKSAVGPKFPRQGAGRIVILGAPNSGKSRLLSELTDANPEVAEFPFTTIHPTPGMMSIAGLQVQLIDTPAITEGSLSPWQLNLVRTADAIVLTMDGSNDDAPVETAAVINELADRKTVLNDRTGFDESDFSIVNVRTVLLATRTPNHCEDWPIRLQFLKDLVQIPFQILQVDWDDQAQSQQINVKEIVFQQLDVLRIFTKKPGEEPDLQTPLAVARNATVMDLALQIHQDLAETLQYARLWRHQQHDGQIIGADYRLRDQDIIELHC